MDKEKEYWETDLDDDSQEELENGKKRSGKRVIAIITLTIFSFFILNSIFRFSSVPDLGYSGIVKKSEIVGTGKVNTIEEEVIGVAIPIEAILY